MRILFIQPNMTFKKHHPLVYKGFAATVPLGIAYMAAYLEAAGHTVRILDYQIQDYDLCRELKRFEPELLGISICSPAVPHAMAVAREARRIFPQMTIIAGGPHVTAYRDAVLRQIPQLDLLAVGEAELTLVALAERLSNGADFSDVSGLIIRRGEAYADTGPGRVIEDLAALPRMPLHLFDLKKYFPLPGTFRRLPSIAMATTRGCPFKCTFCNSKGIWNNRVRTRPPEAVVDEIEWVVREHRAKEIYFVDELFTVNRSHVVTFCEEIMRRGIKIGWKCCSRVDTVDPALLNLMKQSGCFMISYGVESGDDRILKIMKKGITTDQARAAFQMTKAAGISRMAFFILNSYGETRKSTEKTLALSREIKPDFVNFELFKPFPDIEMRKQIENDPACNINYKIWNDWEAFTVGNQIFYTQNDLDEEYLRKVYETSVKGFYLRPGFILKSLVNIKSYDQFKSYFKTFLNMISVKTLDNS